MFSEQRHLLSFINDILSYNFLVHHWLSTVVVNPVTEYYLFILTNSILISKWISSKIKIWSTSNYYHLWLRCYLLNVELYKTECFVLFFSCYSTGLSGWCVFLLLVQLLSAEREEYQKILFHLNEEDANNAVRRMI